MGDCIFCKIAKGEIPHGKIYEDKNTCAFLDVRPASIKGGHTLIIPKKHFELITDVPDNILADLIKTVKKVTNVLLKKAEGVNVLQNNKDAAGQFVKHVHFHLIPRYKDDGIIIEKWEQKKYGKGEMEKLAGELRMSLGRV